MKKALRWIGTALGLLVFLLLVLIGIGTALPVKHAARCTAEIAAPVDAVWKTVDDSTNASWRSDVARVEPGAAPGTWTEIDRYDHAIKFERVSAERNRHVVTRVADPTLPFGGTWTYEFSRTPAGTRLSVEEDGEIYNPVFRLMSRFFIGYTSTMRQYLTDLGKHFGRTPNVACEVTEPKDDSPKY